MVLMGSLKSLARMSYGHCFPHIVGGDLHDRRLALPSSQTPAVWCQAWLMCPSLRLNATCGTLRLADGQPVVVRAKVTGWAADLSAKGGAEGACRLIADRGRYRLQGRRVPPEHGFGQGHAPIHHILHRRHPDLLAEALAEDRAG